MFQTPRPGDPGIIWVGTERILYERKDGNVISQLTRGSAGTSIQDHLIIDIYGNAVSILVVEGSEEETFNRLDTNRAVWLEVGSEFYTYETYNVSSVAYANVEYAETGNANVFARANMSISGAQSNSTLTDTEILLAGHTGNVAFTITINNGTPIDVYFTTDSDLDGNASVDDMVLDINSALVSANVLTSFTANTNISNTNYKINITNYDGYDILLNNGNVSNFTLANLYLTDNVVYSTSNATVGTNLLTLTTTANTIALLNQGGVVAIAANGNLLTAEGTSRTVSYASNVTFFYIKDIDGANSTITVEDNLFMQDGLWDYYAFDSDLFDEDIVEIIDGNVTITLEIPTLNIGSNTALSLADVANADYADTESLMKFIHGI